MHDPKADLLRYLQAAREALLWKLEGYLGDCFGRPRAGSSNLPEQDQATRKGYPDMLERVARGARE